MLDRAPTVSVVSDFEAFFRATEPSLRRALVAGFGGDLGREATAHALAYGWQHWERVERLDNSAGYLYRVGERWARRHRLRTAPSPSFEAGGEARSFEPQLPAALASLPKRQRQAVVLVVGYGLSHSEAARMLGIRRSSVQNHVERALGALRRSIGAVT